MGRLKVRDYGGAAYGTPRTSPRSRSYRCLDCSTVRYVTFSELQRAARPRCLACGGPLEETKAEEKKKFGTPREREKKDVELRTAIEQMKAMPFQCYGCGMRCEELLRLVAHVEAHQECRREYVADGKPLPKMPRR